MIKEKSSSIQFLGLLSNVDSSILKLPLEYGLKIESMSWDDAIQFIGQLEEADSFSIQQKFFELHCMNHKEQKVYYVTGIADPNPSKEGPLSLSREHADFDMNVLNHYLIPLFKKMRLFKDGNVFLAHHYYYPNYQKRKSKAFMSGGTILHIVEDKFTLKDSEIDELMEFCNKTTIPISQSYIQLAFQNFEMSYHVFPQHLEFLLLMIALEALFNPGKEELRYRISRSIAVLLGKNKTQSESIFKEIRNFYDKRSELVHIGKTKISDAGIKRLRFLIRESIKSLNSVNKKKDEVLMILNKSGFGNNPFR